MMDNLVPALLLAAITGLTFLAYKHYQAYLKIHIWLALGGLVIATAALAWGAGSKLTFGLVKPYIPPEQLEDATRAVDGLSFPDWLPLGFMLAMFYVAFLFYLPKLLGKE